MLLQTLVKIYRKSGQDEYQLHLRIGGDVLISHVDGIKFKKLAFLALQAGAVAETPKSTYEERITVYQCLHIQSAFD